MAHSSELFDCVICLQLLEEPVTTACGHSYCMKCIHSFWDTKPDNGGKYSCPQCRTTFRTRPALQKNTLLANLLEEHKKKTTSQSAASAAAAEEISALPEDVQCDACTHRKQKAAMFCLTCLASYCEEHLQPHLDVAVLKKHHLIRASTKINESICSLHDRLLEFYCRSDEQLLCPLCVVEHRDHDIVEVTAEVHEKQKQLDQTRQQIEHKKELSKSKMAQLMEAADSIRDAAWQACNDFEQQCTEDVSLYRLYLEKKCSEMREKAGELEKNGVDWINSRLGPLQREVYELRGMKKKLSQISHTDDPIRFLQDFQALDDLPVFTNPPVQLDTLTEFVTAHRDKIKTMCDKQKDESFSHLKTITMSQILKLPRMESTSRRDMLYLGRDTKLELNPDTVNACLYVTRTNKAISWGITGQAHPDHPDRFAYYYQALCQEGLQGDHYWEVEWDGGIIEVAVSYKNIERKGSGKNSCFGHNKLSWKLICSPFGCTFWHNNLHKGQIPAVRSRRLGVHLRFDEGKLRFYSISSSDGLTLLHQVHTIFTEPIYPGFSADLGATLTIC